MWQNESSGGAGAEDGRDGRRIHDARKVVRHGVADARVLRAFDGRDALGDLRRIRADDRQVRTACHPQHRSGLDIHELELAQQYDFITIADWAQIAQDNPDIWAGTDYVHFGSDSDSINR